MGSYICVGFSRFFQGRCAGPGIAGMGNCFSRKIDRERPHGEGWHAWAENIKINFQT